MHQTGPAAIDRLDTDRLHGLSQRVAIRAAMKILDRWQHSAPEALITGAGILFLLLCKRYLVSERKALEVSGRLLVEARTSDPVTARAIARYLREEM